MPIINAGASTAVTVAVGTYLEGTGAGTAIIGRAAVVEPLTAGDAWQVGPFDVATSVSITASSAISYTVKDNMRDPSEADKLPLATVSAVQSLVSAAGNFTVNSRDGLGRATSFTDTAGTTFTVTYGPFGPLTVSGGGQTRTYSYNAAGQMTGYAAS